MNAPIRLRGHHLLCMLTWSGKGYSEAFSAKFDQVVRAIKGGNPVQIVAGPDDLCRTLDPATQPDYHCDKASVTARDAAALADIAAYLGVALDAGRPLIVDVATWARLQSGFKAGTVRTACRSCEWFSLCSDIAGDDFAPSYYNKEEQ